MNDFLIFYQAAQALLNGLSPYTVPGFFNPAWGLLPFLPLTALSPAVAAWLWQGVTLSVTLIALIRFKLKPAAIAVVVLLSPLVWVNLFYANVDSLVLLGATLPPWAGIWLVSLKPQVGSVVIGLWLLQAWQRGGWRAALKLGAPLTGALALQFVVLGRPSTAVSALQSWGTGLWPLGFGFGLVLLGRVLRGQRVETALAAALCLSPYVGLTSWLAIVPALAHSRRSLLVLLSLTWAGFLMWHAERPDLIPWLSLLPLAAWLWLQRWQNIYAGNVLVAKVNRYTRRNVDIRAPLLEE